MLELGGNIYFTAKLGATDGHSFQHLAAVMTGSTQQDYADDDARRRPLGRRQPQQVGKKRQARADEARRKAAKSKAKIQNHSKAEVTPWLRSSQA